MRGEVKGGKREMGMVVVGEGGRMGKKIIRKIKQIEGEKMVGEIES